jgi:hypothetical protein
MEKTYTATAESSSRNPQDWGRAMAQAMSSLATQATSDADQSNWEDLIGEDLQLHIADSAEGVTISLSWTPGGAHPAEQSDETAEG